MERYSPMEDPRSTQIWGLVKLVKTSKNNNVSTNPIKAACITTRSPLLTPGSKTDFQKSSTIHRITVTQVN